jgi:hypothetical protein
MLKAGLIIGAVQQVGWSGRLGGGGVQACAALQLWQWL